MAMCPRQHKRDILAQTSSGGEVLIFHNPRLAHRRKPWLLVTLQNVSRLQGLAPELHAVRTPLPPTLDQIRHVRPQHLTGPLRTAWARGPGTPQLRVYGGTADA